MKLVSAWWRNERQIVNVLSKNADTIPQFYLKNGKHTFKLHTAFAPLELFADYSCYYIENRKVHFVLNRRNCPGLNGKAFKYYICGDFNGWQNAINDSSWQLRGTDELLEICLDEKQVFSTQKKVSFKFARNDGVWLQPQSFAPNAEKDGQGNVNLTAQHDKGGRHVLLSHFRETANFCEVCEIFSAKTPPLLVDASKLLFSLEPSDKLGVSMKDGKTQFAIFAPRAKSVTLVLREKADLPPLLHALARKKNGVWKSEINGDLTGYLYSYKISGDNQLGKCDFDFNEEIADPYAVAVLPQKVPALVLDRDLMPNAKPFKLTKWQDLCIVEVHIRDVLKNASQEGERPTYSAMRKYVKERFNYFKECGANCVEFQPLQEFDNKTIEEYHWGYMPVNWFSPSSAYATNPETFSQLKEFAELIQAFHDEGFAVLLDVVYNHTGSPNSLARIDKSYYFECAPDNSYINYSGCGNDLRASAFMAKRLISESLEHFVKKFGIDGFRFDLAELLGLECLEYIEKHLKKIKPDVVLIAEPWSFRGHMGTTLKNTGFASWNDSFREFVKDYVLGRGNADGLCYFLRGSKYTAAWPSQTVNYIESHDDKTFFDRISSNFDNPTFEDLRRYKLAYCIVLASVGIPMLAEGFDTVRTKYGANNTYLDGEKNALDYFRACTNSGACEFLRRFAKFRCSSEKSEALRLFNEPNESYFKFFKDDIRNAVGVLFNADSSRKCPKIFAAFNPSGFNAYLDLNDFALENFVQIADTDRFDENGIPQPRLKAAQILKLPALSFSLWIDC